MDLKDFKGVDFKTVVLYALASFGVMQLLGPYIQGFLGSLPQVGQVIFIAIGGMLIYIGIEMMFRKRNIGNIWKKDSAVAIAIGIGTVVLALVLPQLVPSSIYPLVELIG